MVVFTQSALPRSVALEPERIIMFTAVLLSIVGIGAFAASVGTVVVTARDGYRKVPTRAA